MDTTKLLQIDEADGIARVRLNRPDSYNALSPQLVEQLRSYFQELARRPTVRVVILSGAGKHFCVGLDLKQSRLSHTPGAEEMMEVQYRIRDIMLAMRRCPQPIIAILQGAASGGGFAIALAADIRLGTADLRMNSAAIKLGLTGGDMGISYFLPRMIGSSAAAEYLLTGRFLEAQRALGLGLLSRIGTVDELEREALALAQDMLCATPLGLSLTKDGLTHALDASSLEAVMAVEDRQQVLCTQTADFGEGVQAFVEKRKPNYGPRT